MDERNRFLLVLSGLLTAVAFLMVLPFLGYLMGAALLGFLLHPLQERLQGVIGDTAAAGILVVVGIVAVVMPLLVFGVLVADQAVSVAETMAAIPLVDTVEQIVQNAVGTEVDVEAGMEDAAEQFSGMVFDRFSELVGAVTTIGIGIVLLLFVTFYLLKDGEQLVQWLKSMTPLPEDTVDSLHHRLHTTTWAVIKGHVLVAVVQGVLLGIGLAIAGVPNAVFWTFAMILLGFVPVIGSALVWLPAAAYLFLTGQVVAGVLLFVYSLVAATVSDEVIRPIAVDRDADLHPATILVGFLGGIYLFGPVGLFIGPVVLAALQEVLAVTHRSYTRT